MKQHAARLLSHGVPHFRKDMDMPATLLIRQMMMILALTAAAGLLTGVTGCAGSRTEESTGEFVDDAAITTKVKAALVADKQVSALDIKVKTFKGVVQLSGFANNRQEADRAVQLARGVKDVRSVRDDILIK